MTVQNQAFTCSDQTDTILVNAGDTLAVEMVDLSTAPADGGVVSMNVSLEKQ
jgi:hypothetical protein